MLNTFYDQLTDLDMLKAYNHNKEFILTRDSNLNREDTITDKYYSDKLIKGSTRLQLMTGLWDHY